MLRSCKRPRITASVSRLPFAAMFVLSNLLTLFTETSARPLDSGLCAEELLWCTPHLFIKSLNMSEEYSGPPSLDISSGIPNVANKERRALRRPFVPDAGVPDFAEETVGQLLKRSTVTR